jgi:hypothetical protein
MQRCCVRRRLSQLRIAGGDHAVAAGLFWLFEARCQAQRHGEACHALACALPLLCFAYALTGFFSHDLFALDVISKKIRFDAALVFGVGRFYYDLQLTMLDAGLQRLGENRY